MAPSGRRRAKTKTARKTRSSSGTQFKKKQPKKEEETITSTPKIEGIDNYDDDDEAIIDVSTSDCCSTPKGQKFRIPEIVTCPPAPKKPRVVSNCLFKRSPIAFFAPPDLELFFHFANSGISV